MSKHRPTRWLWRRAREAARDTQWLLPLIGGGGADVAPVEFVAGQQLVEAVEVHPPPPVPPPVTSSRPGSSASAAPSPLAR